MAIDEGVSGEQALRLRERFEPLYLSHLGRRLPVAGHTAAVCAHLASGISNLPWSLIAIFRGSSWGNHGDSPSAVKFKSEETDIANIHILKGLLTIGPVLGVTFGCTPAWAQVGIVGTTPGIAATSSLGRFQSTAPLVE